MRLFGGYIASSPGPVLLKLRGGGGGVKNGVFPPTPVTLIETGPGDEAKGYIPM